MIDVLIENLRSDSLHARYGAVMALRKLGPEIIPAAVRVVVANREKDFTRVAALEAMKPHYSAIPADDLRRFCRLLPHLSSPALKIEFIQLLACRHFPEAVPSIEACLDDRREDERLQLWWESSEDEVSTYARNALVDLRRTARGS